MTDEPKKSKQSPFLLEQTALLLNGFPGAAPVLDRLFADGIDASATLTEASGNAVVESAIPLMKSRRRIASPRLRTAPTIAHSDTLQQGFASCEMGFRVSCAAAISKPSFPLWVISGHHEPFSPCPLYPRKRT